MKTFLVSCELHRKGGGTAYPELIEALRKKGAVRILVSQWLVQCSDEDLYAGDLANDFTPHIDNKDAMFVCALTDWMATKNIQNLADARGILPGGTP